MNTLTKYESIEELKADANPAELNSAKSKEWHDRFERFINSLKNSNVKNVSASPNNGPVNKGNVYGV